MSNEIVVHKGRTNVISVSLGIDVSADTITSEVRSEPDVDSPLLMTWTVTFLTDGSDGELVLSVDNAITSEIASTSGYMDLKRVIGTEPFSVFDRPVEVVFRGTVTE